MKSYKFKLVKATILMLAITTITSCSNNDPKDTKVVADEKNEQKLADNEMDAKFLVAACELNREEINLGQLAQQKGNTSHVKSLGKMMEEEHNKSLTELTELARIKNISIPTSETKDGQEAYQKLNMKVGKDFGKEYSNMMVNGHKDAISLFEKASIECTDPEIKAWALATVPTLRKHLELSIECQKLCEKM